MYCMHILKLFWFFATQSLGGVLCPISVNIIISSEHLPGCKGQYGYRLYWREVLGKTRKPFEQSKPCRAHYVYCG